MKNVIILFKNSVFRYSLFTNSEKTKYPLLGFIVIFFLLCLYNTISINSIMKLGLHCFTLSYSAAISSFFIFMMTVLKSNSMFFYNKDFNILSALPITQKDIILSKFLILYFLNLIISCSCIFPAVILLILKKIISVPTGIAFLLSGFILPVIPICIASILSIIIEYCSVFFKRKNQISILFFYLLIIGYFIAVSFNRNLDSISFGNLLQTQLYKIFPLSKLFYIDQNIYQNILKFISLTIIVTIMYVFFIGKNYNKIHRKLNTQTLKNKKTKYILRTPFFSLYLKEFNRFITSPIRVLNCGLGIISLCVLCIGCMILGFNKIEILLGIRGLKHLFTQYGSSVIGTFFLMSCTTSSSISLEGKNLWILQMAPIGISQILNSKIAVNMSIHLIGYFFAMITILPNIRTDFLQILLTVFVPVFYSFFISTVGIFFNIKYLNLNWNDEISVIKHSSASIITHIIAIITIIISTSLFFIINLNFVYIIIPICLIFAIVGIYLYKKSIKTIYFIQKY